MLNVLYCVDGGDLGRSWLEYSIKSLLSHREVADTRIFVASDAPYSRENVTWIDARSAIEKFGMNRISTLNRYGCHPSPMQIFRLAAPWIDELASVDFLLYMDIDTEIVSNQFDKLPSKGFGADVLAVYEHGCVAHSSSKYMRNVPELVAWMAPETVKRLEKVEYFNSGVMWMNLKRIRLLNPKLGASLPQIVELAVRHHRIVVDQDICNVIFSAKLLPPEFNVMPDVDKTYKVSRPCIVHYADKRKYSSPVYPPQELRVNV